MQSITEFLNDMRANDLSDQTIKNVKRSLELLDKFKPLEKCTREDITAFVVSLNGKYKPSSLQVRKINIKQYYKAQGRADLVDHIKIKKVFKDIDTTKLLSVDDINNLIEATASLKYRAIWATMWESGARINEVLAIKRKDMFETDHGFEVKIYSSKTANRTGNGSRKILLIESAGHIRNYQLESTSGDPRLFPVGYDSTIRALRKAGKAAGIGGIYPHLIRHSKATALVKENVQESIIRQQLGWTPDSPMIKRYIHLNDDDLIQNQLQRAGIKKEDVVQSTGLIKPVESQLDKLQEANAQKSTEMEKQNVVIAGMEQFINNLTDDNENTNRELEELRAAQKKNDEQMENLDTLVNQKIAEILKGHFEK